MSAQQVFDYLASLGIPYTLRRHPPVFTVEQARQYDGDLPGAHCKNLFLRNKKGDRYFLAIFEADQPLDLAALAARCQEARLSLASPQRLLDVLGVEPGAVGPFGLLRPQARNVAVLLDSGLPANGSAGFHPNDNTATLTLAWADFERYLASLGNPVIQIPR